MPIPAVPGDDVTASGPCSPWIDAAGVLQQASGRPASSPIRLLLGLVDSTRGDVTCACP